MDEDDEPWLKPSRMRRRATKLRLGPPRDEPWRRPNLRYQAAAKRPQKTRQLPEPKPAAIASTSLWKMSPERRTAQYILNACENSSSPGEASPQTAERETRVRSAD